ncbi:MAG TPA: hypothetical protein VMJ12_13255 [Candidatus Acidoferrales bacterium]|nr:hypothetical protein [Candidatus Acidoferrales bacterium]
MKGGNHNISAQLAGLIAEIILHIGVAAQAKAIGFRGYAIGTA